MYFKEKEFKIFFIGLFLFSFTSLFAQDIVWTTMNDNQYRSIPLNTLKAEIIRASSQFNFLWYDKNRNFISREEYKATVLRHSNQLRANNQSDLIYINQNNQKISWLDSNQDFAYATRTYMQSLNVDSIIIMIVNKDKVYRLSFHRENSPGSYNISRNRDWINQTLDLWLNGMVSQHSVNPVPINNFYIRSGRITRSAPTVNSRDYDKALPTNRFNLLPSNWFLNVDERLWTESRIKQELTRIGLSNVEQNSVFNEVKKSGAIIFYYSGSGNLNFLHIEIN